MAEVMVPDFDIEDSGGVGVSVVIDDDDFILKIRLTNEGLISDVYWRNALIATKAQMYDEFADEVVAQDPQVMRHWKENRNG